MILLWWIVLAIAAVAVIVPLVYGWRYRRWVPPWRQRRSLNRQERREAFEHETAARTWKLMRITLWFALAALVVWLLVAVFT